MRNFDPQRVYRFPGFKGQLTPARRGPLCSGKLDGTNRHFVVGSLRAGLETVAVFYNSDSC
jgi:hypothetical protein